MTPLQHASDAKRLRILETCMLEPIVCSIPFVYITNACQAYTKEYKAMQRTWDGVDTVCHGLATVKHHGSDIPPSKSEAQSDNRNFMVLWSMTALPVTLT